MRKKTSKVKSLSNTMETKKVETKKYTIGELLELGNKTNKVEIADILKKK